MTKPLPHDDERDIPTQEQETSPPEKSVAEERDEYLAGWQRATADYRNLQQTLTREREHQAKYATRSLITDFLELADALRDAYRMAPTDNIAQIDKKLHQLLERAGCTSLNTKEGDTFDPHVHESLGGEGEHVAQIVQQGYRLHDTIIRPTRVILG